MNGEGGPGADGVLAGLAVVQEVGRREEAGDRLHPARLAVDRVPGLGSPGRPAVPSISERCPPPSAPGCRSGPGRSCIPRRGGGCSGPPGSCRDDLGHRVARLAAVDDGEDGVAAVEQGGGTTAVDRSCDEKQAAADDQDDTRAVGSFLGAKRPSSGRRSVRP